MSSLTCPGLDLTRLDNVQTEDKHPSVRHKRRSMFLNQWVSRSEASLDIQRATSSADPRGCERRRIERERDWLSQTNWITLTEIHSADTGVSPSESCTPGAQTL